MPSNTAAMNPQEAHTGGVAAEQAAALLKDLPTEFDEAVQAVQSAMNPEPGVKGWAAFSDDHVGHMESVKRHADVISGNIQGGAEEGARTDQDSADQFPPNI